MIHTNFDLTNGDCLEAIKSIPDESIDLIVTDPPYKTTPRGSSGTMGGYWTGDLAKKGKIFANNSIPCKDYFPQLYRVLKDRSICYIMTNNVNLIEMLNEGKSAGFHFVKSLIWEKGNKICGKYYMGCYEYILLFRKGGDRPINNCGMPDILKVPIRKQKDKNRKNLHDTEKPVELMEILVRMSSDENQTVFDPFMGIGGTGVACVNTNRNFIGIELDEHYFKIADERISKAKSQVDNASL